MGNKKKKIILWLLLAAWMVVIFSFSAMAAPASDELSGGVAEKVIKIVAPGFENYSGDEQAEVFYKINYGIRKIAHASEYAVLGILALLVLFNYKKNAAVSDLSRASPQRRLCGKRRGASDTGIRQKPAGDRRADRYGRGCDRYCDIAPVKQAVDAAKTEKTRGHMKPSFPKGGFFCTVFLICFSGNPRRLYYWLLILVILHKIYGIKG